MNSASRKEFNQPTKSLNIILKSKASAICLNYVVAGCVFNFKLVRPEIVIVVMSSNATWKIYIEILLVRYFFALVNCCS